MELQYEDDRYLVELTAAGQMLRNSIELIRLLTGDGIVDVHSATRDTTGWLAYHLKAVAEKSKAAFPTFLNQELNSLEESLEESLKMLKEEPENFPHFQDFQETVL